MKNNLYVSLLGVILLLAGSSLYAQTRWDKVGKTISELGKTTSELGKTTGELGKTISELGKTTGKSAALSKQLESRVVETFNKAKAVYEEDSYYLRRGNYFLKPALLKEGALPMEADPHALYPYAPEALTRESLKAYIIAKNNLEVRKWLEIQKKREGALDEMGIRPNKDVWVNVPAGEEIPWLVEQIEPDTQYLLVGEEHGFREIQNAVGDLLVSLRRQMPEREIILFTEFWPEGLSTLEDDFYDENSVLTPAYIKQVRRGSQYTKLISSREELKELPIVGLEPSFVAEPGSSGRFVEKYNMSIEKFEKASLWATLEGVRLRNRAWLQTIRTYRQKYPNALFVVYAGSGHLSYDMPYSLGIALSEKGKTFVTEFAYSAGDRFLDLNPVAHCKNEDMAHLVGYDVRIRMRDE